MAEENNEDDSWLYGSSNENQENQDEQPQIEEKVITEERENEKIAELSRNDEYPEDQQVTSDKDHSSNDSYSFEQLSHLMLFSFIK